MLKDEQGIGNDRWREQLLAIQARMAACCAPPVERRDAAEHRQHILDVARRLFAERGVDDVSMHQIAREAGVGQGTLYRRFAHKGELCMALLSENVARVQDEFRAYVEASPPSTTAREQLDHVLSRHVAFNEENGQFLSVMAEAACGPRRAAQYHNPFYSALRQTVETLLERAVAHGEMPPLDSAFTADAILAALSIDLYIYQRTEQGFTPERIMRAVRHLYIDGLCAGDRRERADERASGVTAAE